MEKKEIKMSLGTFILSIIAIIFIVVIVIMGIHISNQNSAFEESKIAMANKENEMQEAKIEKLPTYEYTLKKDDKSGNYYFYSFEKVN